MSFYDDPDNVKSYLKMCEGYDGNNIYHMLSQHLREQSTVLELGSGGGLDIDYLKQHYAVTGSDLSEAFIAVCQQKHPEINFLKINAQSMDLNQSFDCIYSNKVLHHLSEDELQISLQQQIKCLNTNGIIAHSFWLGEENTQMHGMLFTYYRKQALLNIMSESFEIISTLSYTEFEADDSLFIIARMNNC
ncbi:class I SAM-dependent methyltransferase [Marinicellulosiphila megalodicopiae]|uniref:class I SAM-dependent methyltransferase n=1 Tax=Marinicellulosiphila megalodicopiae TaxID=2724896 RepID=UPI003BB0E695